MVGVQLAVSIFEKNLKLIPDPALLEEKFNEILGEIMRRGESCGDIEAAGTIVEGATSLIAAAGEIGLVPSNVEELITSLFDVVQSIVNESSYLRESIRTSDDPEGEEGQEEDEREPSEVQEQEEMFESISSACRDVVHQAVDFLDTLGRACPQDLIEQLSSTADFWTSPEMIHDVIGAQFALCAITVQLEQLANTTVPMPIPPSLSGYIQLLLDGCSSPSPYVMQPAVYGLGLLSGSNLLSSAAVSEAITQVLAVYDYEGLQQDRDRFGPVIDNVSAACGHFVRQMSLAQAGTPNVPKHDASILEQKGRLIEIFVSNYPYHRDESELRDGGNNLLALLEMDDDFKDHIGEHGDALLLRLADAQYEDEDHKATMAEVTAGVKRFLRK